MIFKVGDNAVTALTLQGGGNVVIGTQKKLLLDGGTHTYISETAGDTIGIFTGATEVLTLGSSQDVNIPNGGLMIGSTSSPGADLDIGGATNTYSGDAIILDGGNGGLFITDNTKYLGFWATHGGGSFDSSTMGTRSNHALSLMTNDTKALTIDTSQKVGIATTAPTEKLEVNGAIRTTNNALATPGVADSGVFYFIPTADDASDPRTVVSAVGTAGVGGAVTFKTGTTGSNTEKMRITSGGSVYVGITSAVGTGSEGIEFRGDYGYFKTARNSAASVGHWELFNSNGEVGNVFTSGTSTAYNTSSDYRLKENESPLGDALDLLGQLKPYKFNFKVEPDKEVQGFFAHEVADVVPQAVTGEKDAVKDDGSIRGQSIDHSHMVPLLVAAIQELTAKVEALEANN